ncbi:hypothetical protein L6164_019522 [Bauhinia variegata]|uniref:Uncharacterized protein n=1 Tax=Bauhinia variegata TaxID=167791 RepID=A0ACB9MTP0_BAUVA|nr:hypothetical protein L6164_019522 [Bauhinia variegata]
MAGKSFSDDGALSTKHALRRPCLLLKDYLRDDLSSCSSSGFKSFPRRHCCTTVRFLHDKDGYAKGTLLRRSSTSSRKRCSRTRSALKKASVAVINAVKLLPFPSISSVSAPRHLSQRNKKASLLSRSLSRKLLSRSFWRKAVANKEEEITSDGVKDTRRWRSFREFLEEGNKPFDQNIQTVNTSASIASGGVSTTTSSTSGNSWVESEFTSEILRSSSGNSNCDSSIENDVVGETRKQEHKVEKTGGEIVGVAVGEDSTEGVKVTSTSTCHLNNPRDWPSEEKEQFSPVSILNCPFEEDEEITSPFNPRYSQGREHMQMQKTSMNSQQVVVDLEKRIALLEVENESYNSPTVTKPCSVSPMTMSSIQSGNGNMLCDNYIEGKARDLVDLLQRSTPPNCLMVNTENLLFDFFKQSFEEDINIENNNKCRVLKIAEDWINGKSQQLFLPWEIQEGRQLYVREMDKRGTWKKSEKEKQELALDLEFDLFTFLVNELLLDLTSC